MVIELFGFICFYAKTRYRSNLSVSKSQLFVQQRFTTLYKTSKDFYILTQQRENL